LFAFKRRDIESESTLTQFQDRVLLEGPHSRRKEILLLLRAMRDFLVGFRALHFVGPCVTVFGSARVAVTHPYYEIAREVGRGLGRMGFTVMTGGGPGLMEAANRGARDVGARSVACNIALPMEQSVNQYLDRYVTCRYFFVRKVLLFKYSYGFIAMPGGIGTADELLEALTLIQTKKILNFPVVLMGKQYWAGLITQLQDMVTAATISADDLRLLLITDEVPEALTHIERHAIDAFGLTRRRIRSSRLLGEPRDDLVSAP
jgi:uncharacterized protein (TIGR00730 family)